MGCREYRYRLFTETYEPVDVVLKECDDEVVVSVGSEVYGFDTYKVRPGRGLQVLRDATGPVAAARQHRVKRTVVWPDGVISQVCYEDGDCEAVWSHINY